MKTLPALLAPHLSAVTAPLTATNIITRLMNWTILSSGTFDWLGNTTVSNAIAAAEPQRYFRIRTL